MAAELPAVRRRQARRPLALHLGLGDLGHPGDRLRLDQRPGGLEQPLPVPGRVAVDAQAADRLVHAQHHLPGPLDLGRLLLLGPALVAELVAQPQPIADRLQPLQQPLALAGRSAGGASTAAAPAATRIGRPPSNTTRVSR